MIDVQEVIEHVPHYETFCSVDKLQTLVSRISEDQLFEVTVAGRSVSGVPIHHVRFGSGSIKALIVAGPHCMEPIGSLTVFSLITLLQRRLPGLLAADVEWHIVPCIDPDGAKLNEGWTQVAFDLENFLRNFYLQPLQDGVDTSFPITYKRLAMKNQPSHEARILMGLLETIRPDFYFPLHNTLAGGAFYLTSHDLGEECYQSIHQLLRQHRIPIRTRPQYSEFLPRMAEGFVEMYSVRKHYEFFARTMPSPEDVFLQQGYGGASWDYLEEIKPDAMTFIGEMGYFQHPSYESPKETGQNLRQFKLRIEADSKYLAVVMLDEWERVKEDLAVSSPFFRAMKGLALPSRERILEGGFPVSRYPTRDTLFNPQYDRMMTEGEKFDACVVNDGLKLLAFNFQFLRLLKESTQTSRVRQATDKLDHAFRAAFAELARNFDFSAIEFFGYDNLAKVQLGSGLIALNSLLKRKGERS